MWKEFKEFALKGNVLDLAIGIIIGAAFAPIVKSLVDDIIMPLVSAVLPDGERHKTLDTVARVGRFGRRSGVDSDTSPRAAAESG